MGAGIGGATCFSISRLRDGLRPWRSRRFVGLGEVPWDLRTKTVVWEVVKLNGLALEHVPSSLRIRRADCIG